jgi:uncharacterized protein YkwD
MRREFDRYRTPIPDATIIPPPAVAPIGMDVGRTTRWIGVGIVLLAIAVSVILYAAAVTSGDAPVSVAVGGDVNQTEHLDRRAIERMVADGVDAERAERDRDRLSRDRELRTLARYHSRRMAAEGYVGHQAPDGPTMTERYERFGITCPAKGENVHYERIRTEFGVGGVGFRKDVSEEALAGEVVDGWRESERHYETLLREEWSRQGIGVYLVDTGPFLEIYATQNFCGDAVTITVTGDRRG